MSLIQCISVLNKKSAHGMSVCSVGWGCACVFYVDTPVSYMYQSCVSRLVG